MNLNQSLRKKFLKMIFFNESILGFNLTEYEFEKKVFCEKLIENSVNNFFLVK